MAQVRTGDGDFVQAGEQFSVVLELLTQRVNKLLERSCHRSVIGEWPV